MDSFVYFWDVSSLSYNNVAEFSSHLTTQKQIVFGVNNFFNNRTSFAADFLVKYVLHSFWGVVSPKIEASQHKKPKLINDQLSFSISHSGCMVACIVCQTEIGLDIEVIRPIPQALALANRFFSSAESHLIAYTPPHLQDLLFLKLWTLKESYLKQTGLGLAAGLKSISFEEHINFDHFLMILGQTSYFFDQKSHYNYLISVCGEKKQEIKIKDVDTIEVLNFLKYLEANKTNESTNF